MPALQGANSGINYGWVSGENGFEQQMNENLVAIDALLLVSAIGFADDPPASPSEGDRHIVGTSPTGAFVTFENALARYNNGAWEMFTPRAGWELTITSTGQRYRYTGSAWQPVGLSYTEYADDSAAGTGGVAIGEVYVNSSTGALTVRRT